MVAARHGCASRAWGRYTDLLSAYPLPIQSLTSGVLWAAGEFLSQLVAGGLANFSARRIVELSLYGAAIQGPLCHFWYIILDNYVGEWFKDGTAANAITKVICDTIVELPLHVYLFFAFKELCAGNGRVGIAKKVHDDFWTTYLAECGFWPAFMLLNFWKVPVRHQLLAVNLACILDSTFLCWAHTQEDWTVALLGSAGILLHQDITPPAGSGIEVMPTLPSHHLPPVRLESFRVHIHSSAR